MGGSKEQSLRLNRREVKRFAGRTLQASRWSGEGSDREIFVMKEGFRCGPCVGLSRSILPNTILMFIITKHRIILFFYFFMIEFYTCIFMCIHAKTYLRL